MAVSASKPASGMSGAERSRALRAMASASAAAKPAVHPKSRQEGTPQDEDGRRTTTTHYELNGPSTTNEEANTTGDCRSGLGEDEQRHKSTETLPRIDMEWSDPGRSIVFGSSPMSRANCILPAQGSLDEHCRDLNSDQRKDQSEWTRRLLVEDDVRMKQKQTNGVITSLSQRDGNAVADTGNTQV
jgi:hypothetical protein